MASTPQPPVSRPTRPPAGPPPQKLRKQKRRWIVRLFWLVLVLAIFVGILPYLASSIPAVRNFLLTRAVPDLNGSITAGGASLRWEKGIAFRNISIKSRSKMPVVDIEELEGNRPLWKLLLKPSVLGTYTVREPRLTVVVYPDGTTNLSEVFTWTSPTALGSYPKKIPDVSLLVRMVDGSLKVCDHLGQNAWIADPINFAFQIRPSSASPDDRTWLDIPPQKVFDHVQVTPEICHGLLKYIAPVMAEVTQTKGTFSIDLARWNLPLDAPGKGTGKGVFTVHKLSISAGPIIAKILGVLHIPSELVTIDKAPIQFELVDGRVYHKGLQFHVGRIKFTSSGSVGVKDKSLDMTMVIEFPKEVRPILQSLAGKSITIPIRGTLQQPEVDVQKLGQLNLKTILDTIEDVTKPLDDKETEAPTGDGKNSEVPAVDVEELLDSARELIRRRRERQQKTPLLQRRDRPLLDQLLTPPKEESKE